MNVSAIMDKPKLLALVGPTAVGKTSVSLSISRQFGCEIISGDSMQVYRGMDIGTAKASKVEQELVPHHLIDVRNPDEPFSVSDFQRLANDKIREISDRNRLPFIVGGTGLYVQAVCYHYQFNEGGADEEFRLQMNEYALRHGVEALHEKLREVDPASAGRLHPNDSRRVIRALEIARASGSTMSEQLAAQSRVSPYDLCIIGLNMDRSRLYERIEQRIDLMMAQGLVEEVRRLLAAGYDERLTSMQGLGYKEIAAFLRGHISLEESVEMLKRNTRRFAKRQLSWFRRMNGIHWVDVTDQGKISEHLQAINDIIAGKFAMHTEYIKKQC